MIEANMLEAKTKLAQLVEAAERGDIPDSLLFGGTEEELDDSTRTPLTAC